MKGIFKIDDRFFYDVQPKYSFYISFFSNDNINEKKLPVDIDSLSIEIAQQLKHNIEVEFEIIDKIIPVNSEGMPMSKMFEAFAEKEVVMQYARIIKII